MKLTFYRKKSNDENYYIENPNQSIIVKSKLYYKILFFKVIIALAYAFGLGYNLASFGDDFIVKGIEFLFLLIIQYFLLDYIYSLFIAFLLPNPLSKQNIIFDFRLLNSNIILKNKVKKTRVIIAYITPFIILALIPTLFFIIYGFNLYFYSYMSCIMIKSISYIVYSISIILRDSLSDYIYVTKTAFVSDDIKSEQIISY